MYCFLLLALALSAMKFIEILKFYEFVIWIPFYLRHFLEGLHRRQQSLFK